MIESKLTHYCVIHIYPKQIFIYLIIESKKTVQFKENIEDSLRPWDVFAKGYCKDSVIIVSSKIS
jgi:hypothetical protein